MVSGTTAVCAMIKEDKVYIANVGDSRAVLGYVPETGGIRARPLSTDHKPSVPEERARIDTTSALLMTEKEVRGFGDENKVYIYMCVWNSYMYRVLASSLTSIHCLSPSPMSL